MPKSLLVFAVSSTSKTPKFGTFGGVAHPPLKNVLIYEKIATDKLYYLKKSILFETNSVYR